MKSTDNQLLSLHQDRLRETGVDSLALSGELNSFVGVALVHEKEVRTQRVRMTFGGRLRIYEKREGFCFFLAGSFVEDVIVVTM